MTSAYILYFTSYAVMSPYFSIFLRSLGYDSLFVGILLGLFEGAGIAGPFLLGYCADRTGAYRALIVVSYLCSGFIAAAFFSKSVAVIVFLVIVSGFAYRAISSLLDAALTLHIGKDGNYGRPRSLGWAVFIAMSLFLQWTPVIKLDSAAHIAFWMVFTQVAAAFPVLFIPAKIKAQAEPAVSFPAVARPEAKTAFVTPRFVCGILIMFLCMLAFSPMFFFFPLYVTEALGWNSISLLVAVSAASQVPLLFLFSRLLRRFGSTTLLAVSAFCIAARLLVDAFLPSKAWIIAGQLFDCFGSGVFHAAAVTFISETVPPENRGVGVSIYLSLGSGLPKLAGNILGGVILSAAGQDALRSGYPILFLVSSLFAFLAIGVYFVAFFRRGSRVFFRSAGVQF